ncbi:RpiB/LacA/LacB family sugar-phosphate isomerase [Anaerobium acetethylicum]|uniref:Ribose 5-phosphate isomerase B n=1 Tax=Anaerobium acetethylicum TaxID=1619234 RepID=A0A1D3TW46_9FIRM|nr:RpiB/LacA/LacB family sugar-phosphate isomerase [Anaerobium acetethylicum]SCP98421.1 ribose 5-phosphate isomerase B [Anaerobium acetethylicum]
MKIAIGCDNLAMDLKNKVIEEFTKRGHTFVDMGCNGNDSVDYPEIGEKVADAVAAGDFERGILICGTGIGMSITANKVPGVFAAVCHDIYSTERSILSNNAQIMCMGALVIGPSTAITLVDRWLGLTFKESPSAKKIAKIKEIEAKHTISA